MHWEDEGPYTGEISAPMLKALGCRYVILGHSERRTLFGEDDGMINKKVLAAVRHKLRPILCVGESLDERRVGATDRVVTRQLLRGLTGIPRTAGRMVTIAYEPVWAIGSGQAASPEQIRAVHGTLRTALGQIWDPKTASRVRILYGGSVTALNAGRFLALPEVDGALVGGACLDPRSFARIIAVARSARR
jgi:triosephosphate isomerase